MFKIAIVIFRESLEIALLLGVILAVTKNLAKSRRSIIIGSMIGVFTASIFAFFAQGVTMQFNGLGDEIFDAGIILLTSAIIGWTIIWMQGYEKKVVKNLGDLTTKIRSGNSSHLMLILIVAMSVLREGIEIILFIYSISSTEGIDVNNYIYGLAFGAVSGIITGAFIYNGLMRFAGKYIFKVSSALLIFIAASLASQAAGILTSSGLIETLSDQLWDSSWLLPDKGFLGTILNIVIGYESKPNGMQMLFYIATIAIIYILSIINEKSQDKIDSNTK